LSWLAGPSSLPIIEGQSRLGGGFSFLDPTQSNPHSVSDPTYISIGSAVGHIRLYDQGRSLTRHNYYCRVTVFGLVNHLSISPSHPGQLSLLPSAGLEMSTGRSAMMLCSWGVKAGWLIPLVDKRAGVR